MVVVDFFGMVLGCGSRRAFVYILFWGGSLLICVNLLNGGLFIGLVGCPTDLLLIWAH